MKYLSERYVSVYNHNGFDICALKVAVPSEGDAMGYVIDSELFSGQVFNDPVDAINAINNDLWR